MSGLVAVIGDLALDVSARPITPPRAGGDVPAAIELGPGGQGANVAVRLARRGVPVTLAAAAADDAAGRLLRGAMAAEGVMLAALPAVRSASVIALLDAGGERTMLSDRVTLEASAAERAARGAAWVHCSAYALADDAVGDELAAALGRLAAAGARVSVGGGSLPPDAELAARVRSRLVAAAASLLVFSRDEAAALLGERHPTLEDAAVALRDAFPAAIGVVTGGADGSAACSGGFPITVIGGRMAVVDATGAGDAYTAALVAGLLDAPWPPSRERLAGAVAAATELGARVAGALGAQARVEGEAAPQPLP